ncbi:MAG: hypothetical protein ACRQFF_09535 [Sphaerochaeta sp.]
MRIKEKQTLRLNILQAIYTKVDGRIDGNIDGDKIEKLFPEIDTLDIRSELKYLAEKNYIKFKIKTTGNSVSIFLPISITANGIELIEGIATGGNISKFEKDFSKSIINIWISGNVTDSNLAFGNGNTQTISINEIDIDSIMQFIEKLIKENPNKAELVEAKKAIIEEKKKGELSKFFLIGIGATIKKVVTDVSVGVLTTIAKQSLGL